MSVPASNKRTDLVSLGSANIWVNGVDVGEVKGNVAFSCERTYVDFKPANSLSPAQSFRVGEGFKVTCQAAELKLSNIRMALGVTTDLSSSTVPTGLSSSLSFTVDPAADKYDGLTFGGSKTLDDFPLKLEHTRPNGNKVVICLYKAQCKSNLDLNFSEDDFIMQTLEFTGLADRTRSEGDQVGVIYEQVA